MIDESLVRNLISTQFPQFEHLSVRQVLPGGWDNKTFRLGNQLLVRMPSAERYAPQVKKEQMLPYDVGTWARGRAWVLWKALIIAAGISKTNAVEGKKAWYIIEEVLTDHARCQG